MRILNGLYYQYYRWQVNVGNQDIAAFSSFAFMNFISLLAYLAFLMLFSLFIPAPLDLLSQAWFKVIFVIILLLTAIVHYFLFLHKKKYLEIMNKGHIYGKRNMRVFAIAFPILVFILLNLGWILKMFQNRGDL